MPLLLYDQQLAIVETELELADEYVPMEGQWMFHKLFRGLMPLGPVVYDGKRNAVVLTTAGTTYDFTMTLEEWLTANPIWKVPAKQFITHGDKKDGDSDGEEAETLDT
jgi:hypothetical protein